MAARLRRQQATSSSSDVCSTASMSSHLPEVLPSRSLMPSSSLFAPPLRLADFYDLRAYDLEDDRSAEPYREIHISLALYLYRQ